MTTVREAASKVAAEATKPLDGAVYTWVKWEDVLALRKALEADTVEVPRDAIRPILHRWANCKARYERVGSDWHMHMPGHWPFNVKLTMKDVRDIAAASQPETGAK